MTSVGGMQPLDLYDGTTDKTDFLAWQFARAMRCVFHLLPPGYKGEVPTSYFVMRLGSYSVWAVWRSFLVNGNPKPGVDLVRNHLKVYRLADA
jgi:hypothetical protein